MPDWIPYDHDLPRKPEVLIIASLSKMDPDTVCGKLLKLWAWVSTMSTDGRVRNVNLSTIDALVGAENFGKNMEFSGWVLEKDGSLFFPKWDRYCSNTAKERRLSQKRQQKYRNAKRNDRNGSTVTPALRERDATVARGEESKGQESKEEKAIAAMPTEFPVELRTTDFRTAWMEWEKYKRESRKPLKPTTIIKQLKFLAGIGAVAAVASINQSIANGWVGLFAPDAKQPAGKASHGGMSHDEGWQLGLQQAKELDERIARGR